MSGFVLMGNDSSIETSSLPTKCKEFCWQIFGKIPIKHFNYASVNNLYLPSLLFSDKYSIRSQKMNIW